MFKRMEVQDQPDVARADLHEAWQIAGRRSMRLHLACVHLHGARLFCHKEELKRARASIEQCGQWRRKQELEDAEEAARSWYAQKLWKLSQTEPHRNLIGFPEAERYVLASIESALCPRSDENW